ncbi:23S rRNA (guanosine(2251)-2'-O)-methyltransferase RlmB [Magnetofaba australis]|uniref:Putative RNA methyltransferase n=1 Tax=Magnetofaba australis IT-1 TaxID=1434232 RepID=A0A1Y2K435_9PROT|nr:23S rRNA (guanosine(2251)-2'-O)-methyltransferase RlmB [Magnetofaba australis]OSM01795.1 putative RNA methyltransferase [Magnetofaba australis IT-1]
MSAAELVYGINPVAALLADERRPVDDLWVIKGRLNPRQESLVEQARARGVRPRFVDKATLDRLSERGTHQGIAARGGAKPQRSWESLLDRVEQSPDALLVLLDGVEDPHNLGAILRSAEAFGAMAVAQPKDRSAPLSPVAVKASAGAAERMDLVKMTNLARAIEELQELGVMVIGLAGDEGSQDLTSVDLTGRIALVMGNEGKGLRRLTRERCDVLAAIHMAGEVGSLNVSVATGVALYEAARQRASGRR